MTWSRHHIGALAGAALLVATGVLWTAGVIREAPEKRTVAMELESEIASERDPQLPAIPQRDRVGDATSASRLPPADQTVEDRVPADVVDLGVRLDASAHLPTELWPEPGPRALGEPLDADPAAAIWVAQQGRESTHLGDYVDANAPEQFFAVSSSQANKRHLGDYVPVDAYESALRSNERMRINLGDPVPVK